MNCEKSKHWMWNKAIETQNNTIEVWNNAIGMENIAIKLWYFAFWLGYILQFYCVISILNCKNNFGLVTMSVCNNARWN